MQANSIAMVAGRPVLATLGTGGFARVFLCEDAIHGKVAVKVMGGATADAIPGYSREAFRREVEKLGAVRHENIVRFVGHGEDPPHLVMEYVEGTSLLDLMQTQPCSVAHAVRLLRQIADALVYLHEEMRLVHRDLKPANLLVTANGVVKLVDFGLAIGLADPRLTHGMVATLRYCPPEVKNGDSTVAVSQDVYALGVIAAELLSPAWARRDRLAFPPSGAEIDEPSVTLPLRAMVRRMTATDPSSRPTAAEVRDILAAYLAPARVTEVVWGAPGPPPGREHGQVLTSFALLVALLAVAGAAYVYVDTQRQLQEQRALLVEVAAREFAAPADVDGAIRAQSASEAAGELRQDEALQRTATELPALDKRLDHLELLVDKDLDGVENWVDRCAGTLAGRVVHTQHPELKGCTLEEAVAALKLSWSASPDENDVRKTVTVSPTLRYTCRFIRRPRTNTFDVSECRL